MAPTTNQLDEVYISTYEGMPMKIKKEYFRKHFLDTSKMGCPPKSSIKMI